MNAVRVGEISCCLVGVFSFMILCYILYYKTLDK
jgi:hypothetical protein